MKENKPQANEEIFTEFLKEKLEDLWERALEVFNKYGPNLSFDVTNVIMHAIDQSKVEDILLILEEHYDEHLKFQHPDIRGTVSNRLLGVNPTESMFLRICQNILKLKTVA